MNKFCVKDVDKWPMIIIGNKCDLESERVVTKEDAMKLATNCKAPYLEASAKTRKNVDEVFFELVHEVRKNQRQKILNRNINLDEEEDLREQQINRHLQSQKEEEEQCIREEQERIEDEREEQRLSENEQKYRALKQESQKNNERLLHDFDLRSFLSDVIVTNSKPKKNANLGRCHHTLLRL
jgi:GTPase SAR1 family protein